jgi:hypothetical protein
LRASGVVPEGAPDDGDEGGRRDLDEVLARRAQTGVYSPR